MKYFKNVKSYESLKERYKALLKDNHPDNGGDVEVMQEINVQYDALFQIWKNRKEVETGEQIKETADSTRTQFYTMFGWEGANHDWNRSLKEVAQIVRAYVKEKYPTYKFSVHTSYASMCQELHVEMKESPIEIYKKAGELTEREQSKFVSKAEYNGFWKLNCYSDEEFEEEYNRITDEHGNFFKVMNEATQAVVKDVDDFVNSYNFSDCDGMTDYFHVDFYYFGCCQNNGMSVKIVPKTARIKTKKNAVKASKKNEQPQPELLESSQEITYKITQGEDTRDGSVLWLVRINESLSRDEYITENNKMKDLGGYYSRFRHAFIFRENPTEKLTGGKAA